VMTPGWLLGALLYSASVIFLYSLNRSAGSQFGLCFFHEIFELPCPLCGGTGTFIHLLHGDLVNAFSKNPLVALALILFAGWSLLWTTLGLKLETTLTHRTGLAGLLFLLLVNWAYVLNAG
jgi:hypothetical protein